MNLRESMKMAIRSIKTNKMRAFLTMLGIIIGVASVIVLVSIGQGSSKSVKDQINGLGTNLLTVNITDTEAVVLTDEMVTELADLQGVSEVSPVVTGRVYAKNGSESAQVSMTGTNAAYSSVKDLELSQGRFLSDLDSELRLKNVVLGSDTAETLFGNGKAVGETFQIGGISYHVVGVLQSKGTSLGSSGDDVIIAPISTAKRALKSMAIGSVYVKAESEDMLTPAMYRIQGTLTSLFPNQSDNYSVSNQEDLMETMSSVSDTMTLMLGGIASISLLVGGIGIMNIMLVSVSERTKEIGIRKAIGADRKSILQQFLLEAVVLSSMGGLAGVVIGIGLAELVSATAGLTISLSFSITALAFLFSLFIGVIFGVFPANKASKLNPIQALRYE
ncbi:ABC transporter permease [Peribacillus psychrosaccharolyticus]|uniref:ABC transporter permease n=1 Tax=Peribacillus psychrosaccharolyticus TaxID=1407 RepID=UPI001F37CD01|nr:ABC transporter permease [Peribacillus psychrosaccharolyticus]MEC2055248.1 ABC transporter permease [Peribacillus psychrosaccharolyticus]MED3745238.1 ABC transporter permease [Peribacillus psychrosaccharolyticus]